MKDSGWTIHYINFVLILMALLPFLIALVITKTQGRTDTEFFVLSDLHYDILYSPDFNSGVRCLTKDPGEAEIRRPLGRTRCDPPLELLELTLDYMQSINANPEFIILTGDLIGHFTYTSMDSLEQNKVLVLKSFEEIVSLLKEKFPGTLVVPAIGNNDMKFIGDKDFLLSLYDCFQEITELSYTFLDEGYYAIYTVEYHFIVLNTNLFSFQHQFYSKEAHEQLKWLRSELEEKWKNVIIVMHIPPGFCMYSKSTFEWHPEYVDEFIKIIKEHQETIDYIFAGHFHASVFELIPESSVPILIHPSISPIFGNNPAFRYYTVRDNHRDFTEYSLSLSDTKPQWRTEYTFSSFFQLDSFNFQKALEKLIADEKLLEEYLMHTYGFIDETHIHYFWTRVFHDSYENFKDQGLKRALCSFEYINYDQFYTCLKS